MASSSFASSSSSLASSSSSLASSSSLVGDVFVPTAVAAPLATTTIPTPTYHDIKNYTLIRKLGAGTYGEVWSAEYAGQQVVIKINDADPQGYGYDLAILAEFAFPLTLSHPNIVHYSAIIGPEVSANIQVPAGQTLDAKYPLFIAGVMPQANGDLRGLIKNDTTRAIIRGHFTSLAYQLVDAIAYMTSHNTIHRDLKPENILYDECQDGDYKLLVADFGLSTNRGCYGEELSTHVYTLWYRPPEILMSETGRAKYDAKADVWALGCIFYEMFIGEPLFTKLIEAHMVMDIFGYFGPPPDDGSEFSKRFEKWYEIRKAYLTIKSKTNPLSKIHGINRSIFDLLTGMLQPDPTKRLDIYQVRNHPLFAAIRPGTSNDSCYQFLSTPAVDCVLRDRLFRRNLTFNRLSAKARDRVTHPKNINRLVRWMIEVSQMLSDRSRQQPGRKTFDQYFMALQLLFRSLVEKPDIRRDQLQLWATTALSLANGFVGVRSYGPESFSDLTAKTYDTKAITATQREMMRLLNFDVLARNPFDIIQGYSERIDHRIIALAGDLLLHLSKLPYFFEWRGDRYIYRANLPINCLVLAYVSITKTMPTVYSPVDLNSIETIISEISSTIPTGGYSKDRIGLKISRPGWDRFVATYRDYKAANPSMLRGIILSQGRIRPTELRIASSSATTSSSSSSSSSSSISRVISTADLPILQEFGEMSLIQYEVPDAGSIFGGIIEEDELENLGIGTYDVVIVASCTTNCLDLVKAGIRLLGKGQSLYTTSLVRLAMEQQVEQVIGPVDPIYRRAQEGVSSYLGQSAAIQGQLETLKEQYLNKGITKAIYDIERRKLANNLATVDSMLQASRVRFNNVRDQLADQLIKKFAQRDPATVKLVTDYLNILAPKLGYRPNYYQFNDRYPKYVVIQSA